MEFLGIVGEQRCSDLNLLTDFHINFLYLFLAVFLYLPGIFRLHNTGIAVFHSISGSQIGQGFYSIDIDDVIVLFCTVSKEMPCHSPSGCRQHCDCTHNRDYFFLHTLPPTFLFYKLIFCFPKLVLSYHILFFVFLLFPYSFFSKYWLFLKIDFCFCH